MTRLLSDSKIFETPSGKAWKRIGTAARAGILAPLFSVRTRDDRIGDFSSLKHVVDLCAMTGNTLLQLLPMNDTGTGFCPYDAVSSFAVEPMYISLNNIQKNDGRTTPLKKQPKQTKHVNYTIKQAKLSALRNVFDADYWDMNPGYQRFIEENAYWIYDYALYTALKNFHGGKPWRQWAQEYRERDPHSLNRFRKTSAQDIMFCMWTQWQAHAQLSDVKKYAASRGVLLMGDLPALPSGDSADVWMHPGLFKLDFSSGAPPDMYCAKGQRWGMPTLNWDAVAADGFRYVKEKLRFAENFYDMLRIDHVVGLFRIWSIPNSEPLENQGLNGFFDPPDEASWESHGRKILSVMAESTSMLLCAEDLGTIPDACPKVLAELGIPGTHIQRWTKDWNVRHDFLPPDEYRLLSIAALSTHDTTNFAGWWENEAGTADEELIIRKTAEHRLDFKVLRPVLFDEKLSHRGRLRWRKEISSPEKLFSALGLSASDAPDIGQIYLDSFGEKEKLWKVLKLAGPVREKADPGILEAAMKHSLHSHSIFSVQLIFDWLAMAGILKGDAYTWRINTPGTTGRKNWSLAMPVTIDALLENPLCGKMRGLITESGRK